MDTLNFQKSIWFFWLAEVVFGLSGGWGGAIMTPTNSSDLVKWAYPAIGTIVGLVVGLILIYLFFWFLAPYKQRNEARLEIEKPMAPRSKEQNKRLRIHFDEMKKISSNIIPTLKVDNGKIFLPNSSLDSLSKFPQEFSAHFSQEDNAWNTYCTNIKKHNEKYEEFLKKIKKSFTSAGLKWIDGTNHLDSPGISWRIYDPLFIWWNKRFNHSATLSVDFEKVGSEITHLGQVTTDTNHLWVFGYGAASIAYFDNESDKEKCKGAIRDVAFNAGYEKDSANLISSANELLESVSELKSQLSNKIQDVDKYWPGIKGYKFIRLDQCPRCIKIIEEIKPPISDRGGYQT